MANQTDSSGADMTSEEWEQWQNKYSSVMTFIEYLQSRTAINLPIRGSYEVRIKRILYNHGRLMYFRTTSGNIYRFCVICDYNKIQINVPICTHRF